VDLAITLGSGGRNSDIENNLKYLLADARTVKLLQPSPEVIPTSVTSASQSKPALHPQLKEIHVMTCD
jgi:hypothetical protein